MRFCRTRQDGFTLIEILIALAIFAVLVVGALGVIGAVNQGGLVEAMPGGFATARAAKDYTVATTYLQGLNEYVATLNSGALTCDGTPPPCILTRRPGESSPLGYSVWPPSTRGYQNYQLDWAELIVSLDIWNWDGIGYVPGASGVQCNGTAYSAGASVSGDKLYMVRSRLAWNFKNSARGEVCIERFIPYRPSIPTPSP